MAQSQAQAEESDNPTQYVGVRVSSLCSLYPRPLILTGLFREILTQHFADPQSIEEPDLRHLVWQSGTATSILVEAVTRRIPELTEFRPAVIIKRNTMQNLRLGINDKNQGPPTDGFGNTHYTTFWAGSHTLFCIARSGAQAELLATEVYREIHHFHPIIQNTALLHRLQVTEVGAVAELEESMEGFVVPVTVAYAFQDNWILSQEAPTLRSIRTSFILDDC